MAPSWPKQPHVIGTKVKRLDGAIKASGRAKYSYDVNRPGMLHAVFYSSPHAHAILESLDTSEAEKTPGFAALHRLKDDGGELTYAGEPIVAIAADTEAHAYDALKKLKAKYKVLGHCVTEAAATAANAPKVSGDDANVLSGRASKKGDVAKAVAESAGSIEGDYSLPCISHMCLEAHGMVAEWQDNKLTVWCSTQATQVVAGELAIRFKVPLTNVKCITHYMGGGFGSKFSSGIEGIACVSLAKKAGKPVKLMLDRREEHSAGIRPSASAHIKIAGDKDGKITAFEATAQGTAGLGTGVGLVLPYVYEGMPNTNTSVRSVRINQHGARAYRAPGHPQSCFLMESAVDDLAAKLKLDPLAVRLANLPTGLVGDIYQRELKIGADLFQWASKYHPPGEGGKGPIKHGVGLACHKWGGSAQRGGQVRVEINPDGSVLARSSTQDLGTANRTVLAIVAADTLGLKPEQITVQIGESEWERSQGSGGSTTCPTMAPASLIAATKAREKLYAKIAPILEAKPEDLIAEDGKISVKGGGKSISWADAARKLGSEKIAEVGEYSGSGLSSVGVGGCQFAEVAVDSETGFVRVKEVVAVQDCGLIINKLACESQVAGGVIMAVNAAVFEERVMDQATGRLLNPDMEFYKIGAIGDMPKIKVHMFDEPISQSRGVIGIGEPPTISTLAAIGNAVFNALGVRVPNAPFTPRNVLAALAASKGGAA
jgi:xanthine dehydrogenase YagR molybdenum-binding subunit